MAKVHPNKSNYLSTTSSSSFSSIIPSNFYVSPRRETFTLWMKSLVYHGNGCTVYDSNGNIVYRIDNYNSKRSKEVHLMDRNGKVLFSIRNRVSSKYPSPVYLLNYIFNDTDVLLLSLFFRRKFRYLDIGMAINGVMMELLVKKCHGFK